MLCTHCTSFGGTILIFTSSGFSRFWYSAPPLHACLVLVWMQAACCLCTASVLVLLPLIGYDLGDPKTVSTATGYLLQVSVACRIIFCFLQVFGHGLARSCYVNKVDKKWSEEFSAANRDNDDKIDREEWIASFGDDKEFDAYDLGHDGTVSRAEYLAYERALRGNVLGSTLGNVRDVQPNSMVDQSHEFGITDEDNDGRINRQEWVARFGDDTGFDLHDIRGDGSISRAEFLAYEEFSRLDLDDDGKITREEWVAHFGDDTGFDVHDKSHNGTVSRAELFGTLATLRRSKWRM